MGELSKLFGPAARRSAQVRVTSPVLARYLDDLRLAEQAKALDMHFGRIPKPAGMFDNINLPAPVDPVALERAVGAAPRAWLEGADMARAMEPQPAAPLTDMLLDNDRRRALIANRLDRLTPEQQARSLPVVGRQYEADQAAARAAQIKRDADAQTAAALLAASAAGVGALAARTAQLANENANYQAGIDADIAASLSGNPDGAMPMTIDTDYDPLMESVSDSVSAMKMPLVKVRPPRDFEGEALIDQLSQPQEIDVAGLFSDDPMLDMAMDAPAEAVASAPGPSAPVGRTMDMETLPGPQLRSIKALIRAGIPAGRAMDIITKGASMSPDEYRMVTGGRR